MTKTRYYFYTLSILFLIYLLTPLHISAEPSQNNKKTKGNTSGARTVSKTEQQQTNNWPLPPPGPPGKQDKMIVFIGEDLRNSGVLGVSEGVREAAHTIKWKVNFFDIGAKDSARESIFEQVRKMKPDGIILGSMDAENVAPFLIPFQKKGVPIVGWHVSPFPGTVPNSPIQLNVTANSAEVAKAAAQYVITESKGKAKVVIFTDNRFAIAAKKADIMVQTIQNCEGCEVLEIVDLPLDKISTLMGKTTERLLNDYADTWQYSLAINDLYFDYAVAYIVLNGNPPEGPPINVSAGDGSPSALLRIKYGSYQKATIPEPLLLHGWQLVDELNRMMHGHAPSNYQVPFTILTMDDMKFKYNALNLFDPENGYRQAYRNIWKRY